MTADKPNLDIHSEDLSTDELVRAVRAGRVESFAHIVHRYQVDVAKIVHVLLLDRSTTEDLVQDIFLKAFEHIEQYRLGEGFGKWVRGIARNTVRQELRRRSRESARMKTYAAMVESQFAAAEQDQLIQAEWEQSLRDCLGRLDESAAELVRLRYVGVETFDNIARRLGQTSGAIRTRLYRLRLQLQACLEAKGVDQ